MKKPSSVFISYNPKMRREEILAEGLYKKGRQNGFDVFMPARTNNGFVSSITESRIKECSWFVVFCFEELSDTVHREIQIALRNNIDPAKIIVVYSSYNGQIIDFGSNIPTVRYIDDSNYNYNIENISNFSSNLLNEILNRSNKTIYKTADDEYSFLKFILGVGAAALLIKSLSTSKA